MTQPAVERTPPISWVLRRWPAALLLLAGLALTVVSARSAATHYYVLGLLLVGVATAGLVAARAWRRSLAAVALGAALVATGVLVPWWQAQRALVEPDHTAVVPPGSAGAGYRPGPAEVVMSRRGEDFWLIDARGQVAGPTDVGADVSVTAVGEEFVAFGSEDGIVVADSTASVVATFAGDGHGSLPVIAAAPGVLAVLDDGQVVGIGLDGVQRWSVPTSTPQQHYDLGQGQWEVTAEHFALRTEGSAWEIRHVEDGRTVHEAPREAAPVLGGDRYALIVLDASGECSVHSPQDGWEPVPVGQCLPGELAQRSRIWSDRLLVAEGGEWLADALGLADLTVPRPVGVVDLTIGSASLIPDATWRQRDLPQQWEQDRADAVRAVVGESHLIRVSATVLTAVGPGGGEPVWRHELEGHPLHLQARDGLVYVELAVTPRLFESPPAPVTHAREVVVLDEATGDVLSQGRSWRTSSQEAGIFSGVVVIPFHDAGGESSDLLVGRG